LLCTTSLCPLMWDQKPWSVEISLQQVRGLNPRAHDHELVDPGQEVLDRSWSQGLSDGSVFEVRGAKDQTEGQRGDIRVRTAVSGGGRRPAIQRSATVHAMPPQRPLPASPIDTFPTGGMLHGVRQNAVISVDSVNTRFGRTNEAPAARRTSRKGLPGSSALLPVSSCRPRSPGP